MLADSMAENKQQQHDNPLCDKYQNGTGVV
jgi:hypothetical protein